MLETGFCFVLLTSSTKNANCDQTFFKKKNIYIYILNIKYLRSENCLHVLLLINRVAKLWLSQAEDITACQTQQLVDGIPKSVVGLFIAGLRGISRSMICPSEENIKYLLANARHIKS